MDPKYKWFQALAELPEMAEGAIVSRVILNVPACRATAFALDAGQALTEHTASRPAWVFFLEGEAEFRLGDECHQARAGSAIFMAADVPHSLTANTATRFLLVLLKAE